MCPLRFILVFFSAIFAGYFAWKYRSFSDSDDELNSPFISQDFVTENGSASKNDKQERNFLMTIQDGFWVFVDMASGKYLWKNLKELKAQEKVKSC